MAGRNGPGPDRLDGRHRARSQRCHATGAGAFARLSGAGNCGSDARRGIAQDTACDAVALAGRGRGPHPGARPAWKPTRRRRQSRGCDGGVAPRPAHLTQPGQRQPGGAPAQLVGQIKVGISSWTEPTLVKSGWYPPTATTAEDRLRYYASKFPVVEIDSTFYAIPNENTAELWVARTPKDFTFNAKAYALLTQHPTPVARLPKDLREKLSDSKANLYFKDLGPKEKESVWDRFREGLQPLHDAGKLGAIVFQFPKWFLPSPSAYRFMEDLREWLPDFGIAIEFRQASWLKPERRQRVLDFLKGRGFTYVVVDEPQGFPSSVPPVAATTGPLGMVRFHGHNNENWEKRSITAAERFRYLYQSAELKPWVPTIREMAKGPQDVHAVMNNCYSDYAVRNAQDLADLLN